LKEEKKTKIKY